MNRTLGRFLLVLLVALGVTSPGAARATGCDEAQLSLSCTGLVPAPEPEPEPEPAPPPEPAPEPEPTTPPEPQPEAPADHDVATDGQAVERLRSLIDADRRAHGLGALATRSPLSDVAVAHSRSMAERGELWHNDDLFSRATKDRLGLRLVGENVAANGSIDDAHRRLMASAGHRANLLSASFVQLGLGVARTGTTWFITEVFATPSSSGGPAPATAVTTGASPAGRRPSAAPPSPATLSDGAPSPAAAPAAAGAAAIAVHLEVPVPADAASSSMPAARSTAVRTSLRWAPILLAALLLVGVTAMAMLVPHVRSTLVTHKTAVLSRFNTWRSRPHLPRAVVGPRPRRLGAP